METTCRPGKGRALITKLMLMLAALGLPGTAFTAEQIGDVAVSPQSFHSGETYHGYGERLVVLENRSGSKAHLVVLSYPQQSWNYGESISRLTRTVKLPPQARVSVPLWQPALPINGDNQLKVEVDGEEPKQLSWPSGYTHAQRNHGYYGNDIPATVLASRSLDADEVKRVLHHEQVSFSAEMATGAPDSTGSGTMRTAWMPDESRYGAVNWLELDFDPPLPAAKIRVHQTGYSTAITSLRLTGTSGTNVALSGATLSSSKFVVSTGSGEVLDYACAFTNEPVKTVRLEFGTAPPSSIGIDAVQISGPKGSAWAGKARASSDNSRAASRYGGSAETLQCLRAELPVPEWSENWLSYSPYDLIILPQQEWSRAPGGVTTALWRYVEAGGNLLLLGGGEVPAPWNRFVQKVTPDLTGYTVGFGECLVARAEKINQFNTAEAAHIYGRVTSTSRYWQSLPANSETANSRFPVVSNVQIPARGIVVVMLAFIILIGPVNIVLLNRRQRRTWMLWTIPAISIATTVLVFVYSFVREGFTPDTRIRGLTILDQQNRRATTIGVEAFYCPLTPSQGLNFSYDTEITAFVDTDFGNSRGSSREMDWSGSQHLRRGWIAARVPAHFHLRKTETQRARLQVEKGAGELQVVNGLGGAITSLWLADADGNIFAAKNLGAGQKVRLQPFADLPKVKEPYGLERLQTQAGFTADLPPDPARYLTPNTYLAEIDSNPFLENGLGDAANAKRTRASALVFGLLETETNGGRP